MFGTRTVRQAVWTNGKRKITGCWEYSGILDKYDIWLEATDPATGERLHHIVEGSSETGPEWNGGKIVKPGQKMVDKPDQSGTTDP